MSIFKRSFVGFSTGALIAVAVHYGVVKLTMSLAQGGEEEKAVMFALVFAVSSFIDFILLLLLTALLVYLVTQNDIFSAIKKNTRAIIWLPVFTVVFLMPLFTFGEYAIASSSLAIGGLLDSIVCSILSGGLIAVGLCATYFPFVSALVNNRPYLSEIGEVANNKKIEFLKSMGIFVCCFITYFTFTKRIEASFGENSLYKDIAETAALLYTIYLALGYAILRAKDKEPKLDENNQVQQ